MTKNSSTLIKCIFIFLNKQQKANQKYQVCYPFSPFPFSFLQTPGDQRISNAFRSLCLTFIFFHLSIVFVRVCVCPFVLLCISLPIFIKTEANKTENFISLLTFFSMLIIKLSHFNFHLELS